MAHKSVTIDRKRYYLLDDGSVVYPGDLCPLREAAWYDGSEEAEQRAKRIEARVRGKAHRS